MSPDVIDNPTPHEFYLHEEIWNCYKNEYPFMFKGERFDTTKNETIEGYQLPEVQYHCPINLLRQTYLDKDYNILYAIIHDKALLDPQAEDHIFYTHNDHLGSASWITRYDGKPIQYIHYLPYGQLLANQMSSSYDERFKFIGKERDVESGYDFFGARYFISPFKHWLSVDPWADKYPQISPYAYCMWNPTTNLDPNGCGDPLTVMKVRRMMINHTFGMVRHYPDGSPKPHQGIDYYAPVGTDIMAVKTGTIVGCDFEGKGPYGKTITLQFEQEDGSNAWAFYSHLSEISINVDDHVIEGDIIGKTGITGNADNLKGEDQHLHFEYRTGGAQLGKGLNGREDPNLIVDTKFEPDPNNKGKLRYMEE